MLCRTAQNRPLLRRWLPRLTWISFHQAIFSCFRTKTNRMRPNLDNRMDEAAIRSVIRPVLLWQLQMSELVRCHVERALFSSPNGAVFSSIQPRIGPINQHTTAPWLSFPSPNSRWRWCRANPKKRWPWPFHSMEPFSPSLEHVRRVKTTVLTVLSFLACSDGSMFRQQSRNAVETLSDCA